MREGDSSFLFFSCDEFETDPRGRSDLMLLKRKPGFRRGLGAMVL